MAATGPMRLVFVGWGAMAQATANVLTDPAVQIVAIAKRSESVDDTSVPAGALVIHQPDELASINPDVVAEAAGLGSVAAWGHAALNAGADFIVSSVSALADADLLMSLKQAASRTGARVVIQPGALAGVEALAAARLMGLESVEHRIVKPPGAWRGTPAAAAHDLDALTEEQVLFSASASETALAFPKNANVAMTTALAGVGPDATNVTLVADPAATKNRHELRAHGAFGRLEVVIANNPLAANPKTSTLAALSLARCIENRVSPLVI